MTFGNAGATRTGLTFPLTVDEEEFIELERLLTTLLADVDNTEKQKQKFDEGIIKSGNPICTVIV